METRLVIAYSLIAAMGLVALLAACLMVRNRRRLRRRMQGQGGYKN